MRERTGPMAAEQGRTIPPQLSRAPGPIFTPGQEIVAVAQKLARSVRWDVGEWAMVVEARDPVDPTGRNATCSHIGRYFFRIMSLPRPFIRYITPRPGQGFTTSARPHKGYPHCDQRESCDWRRAPMARPCSKRTGRCPRAGEWCLADPPCHSCL